MKLRTLALILAFPAIVCAEPQQNLSEEQYEYMVRRLNSLELTLDTLSAQIKTQLRQQNAVRTEPQFILQPAPQAPASPQPQVSKEDLSKLSADVDQLSQQVKDTARQLQTYKTEEADRLNSLRSEHKESTDALSSQVADTNQSITALTDDLHTRQSEFSRNLNIAYGVMAALFLLGLLYLAGSRSRNKKILADLSSHSDSLQQVNDNIIAAMQQDMTKLEELCQAIHTLRQLCQNTLRQDDAEIDHKLILNVANKVTFMEVTLSRLDPKMRGFKQLSRSIEQIKANLAAHDYEIVDMLGKPYHEGMNVSATFVENEDLPEGAQIITGISVPQVNYKGVLIQSAQITVSQNI